MSTKSAIVRAQWQVVWITDDGRVVRKNTGTDFHEAIRIYTMAVEGGRRAPTLRSRNVAFPPPEKYHPRFEDELDRRGRPTGEVFKVEPLYTLNRKGQWWCPFCVKFRAFRYRSKYTTDEGVEVHDPAMVCPMCHVTHQSFDVKFWNPLARTITEAQMSAEGKARRRRKRQRQRKENDG